MLVCDGYGWVISIEGKDNMVEKHRGAGSRKKNVIPEGFREFEKNIFELAK